MTTTYRRNTLPEGAPSRSPWGTVQSAERIAEGIHSVGTAGHGGIHLSRERAAALRKGPHAALAACSEEGKGIWFEEDCAVNACRIAFAEEFERYATEGPEYARGWLKTWTVEDAREAIRTWYPEVAHAAGFGHSPADYADCLSAALHGRSLPGPSVQITRGTWSAHVVGGDSSDSATAVQIRVGAMTLGFFDGEKVHCERARCFAHNARYFDDCIATLHNAIDHGAGVRERLQWILAGQ